MTRTSVLLGCDQEMLPHRLNDRERGQPVKEVDVPYRITDLPDRIADKIMPTLDGCWLWTASDVYGYGQATWEQTSWRAHRLTYTLLEGPIPDGLQIDHLCRVPACVNPAHLEPVTPRVNVLRSKSVTAANHKKTHCPEGHEYTDENTYLQHWTAPTGAVSVRRSCRECNRLRAARNRGPRTRINCKCITGQCSGCREARKLIAERAAVGVEKETT